MVVSLQHIKTSEVVEILSERLTGIITHINFTKVMIKVLDQVLKEAIFLA